MSGTQTIEKPDTGTDLAIIGGTVTALTVFGTAGGVDAILERITAQARAVETDISTPAGRKAVASLAYRVARSKTALDALGKDLGEQNYRAWKAITSERARIGEALDALAADIRRPLTEYEEAEKARVAAHERELSQIPESIAFYENGYTTSEEFRVRLAFLNNPPSRDWQEFAKRAADTIASEIAKTQVALDRQIVFEAAVAEQKRIEAEEAERVRAELAERQRQRVIAAAEKARHEADERARVAAEAEARRAAADKQAAVEKVEREKREAEAKAKAEAEAIATRIELDRQAEALARRQAEQKAADELAAEAERAKIAQRRAEVAEAARIEVAARAKADAEKAAKDAEISRTFAIAEAAKAERQRIADKQAKEAAETAAREANTRHRGKIHSEAVDDLVAATGITQAGARAVVTAIVSGKVRHTRISY